MHNEGFGKKWIDRILGKVDKDQGVANAGKVLGIGNDGQVVPVEQSGGGETGRFSGTITGTEFANKVISKEIKIGDTIKFTHSYTVYYPSTLSIATIDESIPIKCVYGHTDTFYNNTRTVYSTIVGINDNGTNIFLYLSTSPYEQSIKKSVTVNGETLDGTTTYYCYIYELEVNKANPRVEFHSHSHSYYEFADNKIISPPFGKYANFSYTTLSEITVNEDNRS